MLGLQQPQEKTNICITSMNYFLGKKVSRHICGFHLCFQNLDQSSIMGPRTIFMDCEIENIFSRWQNYCDACNCLPIVCIQSIQLEDDVTEGSMKKKILLNIRVDVGTEGWCGFVWSTVQYGMDVPVYTDVLSVRCCSWSLSKII